MLTLGCIIPSSTTRPPGLASAACHARNPPILARIAFSAIMHRTLPFQPVPSHGIALIQGAANHTILRE